MQIYINVKEITEKKEDKHLKDNKEGYIGGFDRGKRKTKWFNKSLISEVKFLLVSR